MSERDPNSGSLFALRHMDHWDQPTETLGKCRDASSARFGGPNVVFFITSKG